jgi:nitrogen-specific signal transduction histidine kinase
VSATRSTCSVYAHRIDDGDELLHAFCREEGIEHLLFYLRPAGEGTGLGLSITHDIIVKQHSGSIEVDTQPGEFTEVRIILPRAAAF